MVLKVFVRMVVAVLAVPVVTVVAFLLSHSTAVLVPDYRNVDDTRGGVVVLLAHALFVGVVSGSLVFGGVFGHAPVRLRCWGAGVLVVASLIMGAATAVHSDAVGIPSSLLGALLVLLVLVAVVGSDIIRFARRNGGGAVENATPDAVPPVPPGRHEVPADGAASR